MNNIFLTSDCCDSFEEGVVVTTLPSPIDIREDMGVNLCELSISGLVNIPGGLQYKIGGMTKETAAIHCLDPLEFLNSLCTEPGYRFEREPDGKLIAKFEKGKSILISEGLQAMTGFGRQKHDYPVTNGDYTYAKDVDLFYYASCLTVETDIVVKQPIGSQMRHALRMVPLSYRSGESLRFQFYHSDYVPIKKGTEIETIKLYLTNEMNDIVNFKVGGGIQAHLQLCPISSRLLV
jgi:hypothetical protein